MLFVCRLNSCKNATQEGNREEKRRVALLVTSKVRHVAKPPLLVHKTFFVNSIDTAFICVCVARGR